MLPASGLLVIVDGDLPGMVACAAAAEAAKLATPEAVATAPVAWMPDLGHEDQPVRMEAARRTAEYFGLRSEAGSEGFQAAGEHERVTRMLVEAAFEAIRQSGSAVLWPICCQQDPSGDLDLGRIGLAADRALLVQRLVSLGPMPVRVLTPYLDFTEPEIADLAMDLNVPVRLCWWWDAADGAAAAERARWMGALKKAGWSATPDEPAASRDVITRGAGGRSSHEEVRRA